MDPPLEEQLLVVEGFITDEFGPHEIRLSRLARFTGGPSRGGTIFPIFNAQVYITDDQGERTDLTVRQIVVKELARGGLGFPPIAIFRTPNDAYVTPEDFRAEPGRSYSLNVITDAGIQYVSSPQQVSPGPEIDSIFFRYKRLPSTDPILFDSGMEVFSSWEDPVEERNFYSWRVNGTYFVETTDIPGRDPACFFDPNDGCCDKCFIEEKNIEENTLAFSDVLSNGSQMFEKVGFIQDNGIRFANESVLPNMLYHVEIEQHSISQEAFSFYSIVRSQLQIGGDIFDPPPANIGGNMTRVDRPEEQVLGFFSANSVKRYDRFIERREIDFIQPWPDVCGDCRIRSGATLETPEPYLIQ